MAERILILGASGFIGRYVFEDLRSRGHQLIGTCHTSVGSKSLVRVDLRDADATRRLIAGLQPSVVVFLAGTKDVARCENDPGFALDLNVSPIRNYIGACLLEGLRPATLFFSTDYVFDGKHGQYRASDLVGPSTMYGMTNLIAERVLATSGLPGVLLRVSAVMGRRGGFFAWLERELAAGKPISLFDNTWFSPTGIGRLCNWVADYLHSAGESAGSAGMKIAHLSDGYRLSRHEFGKLVALRSGYPGELVEATQADLRSSTFQRDLSLLPDGLNCFRNPDEWDELENIL